LYFSVRRDPAILHHEDENMQITDHIHAIRIPFRLEFSPEKSVERFVYAFMVFDNQITLIDSGVSGSEHLIFDYIRANGRHPDEIGMLVLSHSHPDHIGSAKAIKAETGCTVLAHKAEKAWIEDTDLQFKERPVPGYHKLVGGPVSLDRLLVDGQTLDLGGPVSCEVLHTPGHSAGSISLFFGREKALFSGDALILPGELPIYDDIRTCVASMKRLRQVSDVEVLLSSWEAPIEGREAIMSRIQEGIRYLERIHQTVLELSQSETADPMELCQSVVEALGLPMIAVNPIVAKAFASSLGSGIDDMLFDQ